MIEASRTEQDHPTLRRSLTLPLLTLYGLGVTVGAGIYVLIGATVSQAGPFAWIAFLLAAVVVGFTALSYAELATRYPVSAGEAVYVQSGFGRKSLATAIGCLVAISGMISAAAITVGAAGYLAGLIGLPPNILIISIVVSMAMLAYWGITQSVTVAATVTVIEILGLGFVIVWGMHFGGDGGLELSELIPVSGAIPWGAIFSASLLAFFAFVGFEDMVNVAEEVKEPRRTFPKAILITLAVATLLYVATCIAVLLSVPLDALNTSNEPLALVFSNAPQFVQSSFSTIAVVATVNGVLIQMIMSSRVFYGMAARGQLPKVLARLSTNTRTPSIATGFVALSILALSLLLPIHQLAEWTSQIVLFVFVFVNASLIAIKNGKKNGQTDHFSIPIFVPILGIIASVALLSASLI